MDLKGDYTTRVELFNLSQKVLVDFLLKKKRSKVGFFNKFKQEKFYLYSDFYFKISKPSVNGFFPVFSECFFDDRYLESVSSVPIWVRLARSCFPYSNWSALIFLFRSIWVRKARAFLAYPNWS
jgi:hypothetical protein